MNASICGQVLRRGRRPDRSRIRSLGLKVVEGDQVAEGELDLGLVEHVKEDHFVAAVAEVVQRADDRLADRRRGR